MSRRRPAEELDRQVTIQLVSWGVYDRFNVDRKPRPNRFGWIVEIDPHPTPPVKHPALGPLPGMKARKYRQQSARCRLQRRRFAVSNMSPFVSKDRIEIATGPTNALLLRARYPSRATTRIADMVARVFGEARSRPRTLNSQADFVIARGSPRPAQATPMDRPG